MKTHRIVVAFILIILISPFSALAQEKISVGVAANFISAFKEIAADFVQKDMNMNPEVAKKVTRMCNAAGYSLTPGKN